MTSPCSSRLWPSHYQPILQWLSFFFFFFFLAYNSHPSHADVGTAARYSPPYSPTACYGSEPTQFPSSNLFAAAGEGVWDNGASCGRQYLVRCISSRLPGTCVPAGKTIQIIIVDYSRLAISPPSAPAKTIVLSDSAFAAIANSTADSINIDFQQV
ncbi:hypothetical protein M9H77_04594 [Catharanthus roseus]|uniref:Uncharacterized protein n=1 Tax=Catharanthus roseus TaxID=4058 RepID=A0ACC0CF32_CATRO|nr:hypothetical protein M9H77_04594 [Catharanthus roseus]